MEFLASWLHSAELEGEADGRAWRTLDLELAAELAGEDLHQRHAHALHPFGAGFLRAGGRVPSYSVIGDGDRRLALGIRGEADIDAAPPSGGKAVAQRIAQRLGDQQR